MKFSEQEYWNGLPFPTRGIKPSSLVSLVLTGGFFTAVPPGKPPPPLLSTESETLRLALIYPYFNRSPNVILMHAQV